MFVRVQCTLFMHQIYKCILYMYLSEDAKFHCRDREIKTERDKENLPGQECDIETCGEMQGFRPGADERYQPNLCLMTWRNPLILLR